MRAARIDIEAGFSSSGCFESLNVSSVYDTERLSGEEITLTMPLVCITSHSLLLFVSLFISSVMIILEVFTCQFCLFTVNSTNFLLH